MHKSEVFTLTKGSNSFDFLKCHILSVSVCAVIDCQIDLGDVTGMSSVRAIRLGDVTETNRIQTSKQQTARNQRSGTGTIFQMNAP